jgi:hypothetical protein
VLFTFSSLHIAAVEVEAGWRQDGSRATKHRDVIPLSVGVDRAPGAFPPSAYVTGRMAFGGLIYVLFTFSSLHIAAVEVEAGWRQDGSRTGEKT